eukprot:12184-Heterococcus_DN1.PRE.4
MRVSKGAISLLTLASSASAFVAPAARGTFAATRVGLSAAQCSASKSSKAAASTVAQRPGSASGLALCRLAHVARALCAAVACAAAAPLHSLRAAGKRIFFVTNNSTKSRKGYKKKFDELGLDVQPEEIFSSSFAAAAYLEQTNFKATGKKVYVIGEVGILDELDLIGVPHIGGPHEAKNTIELKPGFAVPHDHDVGGAYINYYKIQYAQLCINENKGCEFIATNLDAVTHLTDAQEWAGNGSMVGAIKGCTGVEPTVVGKPSPLMIDYMVEKFKVDRSRICMCVCALLRSKQAAALDCDSYSKCGASVRIAF